LTPVRGGTDKVLARPTLDTPTGGSTMRRLISFTVAAALVTATLLTGPAAAQKKGGVLRIGNLGEPPSLDPHWGTQTITEVLTNHIFEGLYSLDESYRPTPMLAEGLPTISRDGLTYTFKLRQGVKFHNGKEMTSADVVASLVRWSKRSIYGKSLFAQVADFKTTDKYSVEMKLKEKSAIVLISLAVPNNFGAIYPKEVAEKFPPDQRITEFVGTGPFKLVEWKPDQYIRMVRFDEYKPRVEKQSGYGGAKIAFVDELRWIPVPDAASRAAQLESGDLDVADDLVADAYDRLKANPNVQPVIVKPYYWLVAVFNKKEGLMTNQKLRQAWQAALDIEPIMKTVAGGKSEFYRMDSSLAFQELPAWHTKISGLPWNEHDKDKARRLLKEAGYKGEPIRFMTTQEYKWMYDFALVSKQQLEEVGFKIDLQVMDWSTLGQRRIQPKEYDVFTTGIGGGYDPTHHVYLTPTWPGWTEDEQIASLIAQLARETDAKKRYDLWVETTKVFYEKVPVARYGDLFGLRATRKTVKGFNDKTERPRFWGVWLDK
jgi:peptide/nickel transport system substrate-binding protein